jgi:hypothetical protein
MCVLGRYPAEHALSTRHGAWADLLGGPDRVDPGLLLRHVLDLGRRLTS